LEEAAKPKGALANMWAALQKRFTDPVDLYLGGTSVVHLAAYWGAMFFPALPVGRVARMMSSPLAGV